MEPHNSVSKLAKLLLDSTTRHVEVHAVKTNFAQKITIL